MQKLNDQNINLPDFVTMTNYCEEKGYEVATYAYHVMALLVMSIKKVNSSSLEI